MRNICKTPACSKHCFGHGLCQLHYVHKYLGVSSWGSEEHKEKLRASGRKQKGSRHPDGKKFLSHIRKSRAGCWIWTAATFLGGYARFKDVVAHRWAWKQVYGDILTPNDILHHTCENKSCVYPGHLMLVTAPEHSQLHKELSG